MTLLPVYSYRLLCYVGGFHIGEWQSLDYGSWFHEFYLIFVMFCLSLMLYGISKYVGGVGIVGLSLEKPFSYSSACARIVIGCSGYKNMLT
ncbi:hypothetical protein SLA2020_057340 [Shorea laevis]